MRTRTRHWPRMAALTMGLAVATLAIGCSKYDRDPLYTLHDTPAVEPVGVFDRTEVLIAYHKSAHQARVIADLRRQRDDAVARGDLEAAKEFERRGAALQETAHRQLTGDAPLTNVRELIAPELERIARDAGVVRIVPRGAEPFGSSPVDVTDAVVAALAAAQ